MQYSPDRVPKPKPVINSKKVKIPNTNSMDSVAVLQGSLDMAARPIPAQCEAPPVISQRRPSLDASNRDDRIRGLVFRKSSFAALSQTSPTRQQEGRGVEQGYEHRRKSIVNHPNQHDHFKEGINPDVPPSSLGDAGRFHRPPSPRVRARPQSPCHRSNTVHIFGSKSEADLKAAYVAPTRRSTIGDASINKTLSDQHQAQARRKSFAIEYVKPRTIRGLGSLSLVDEIPTHADLLERTHDRDQKLQERRVRAGSVGPSDRDTFRDIFGGQRSEVTPMRGSKAGTPLSATRRGSGDSSPPPRAASAPRAEWHGTKKHITTPGNDKDSGRVLNPSLLETHIRNRRVSCSPQRVGRYDMNAVLSAGSPARGVVPGGAQARDEKGRSYTQLENPPGRRTAFSLFEAPKLEPRPFTPQRAQSSQLWGILGGPSCGGSDSRPPSPSGRAMSTRNSHTSSIVFC